MALAAREQIQAVLGVEPVAPAELVGSMAAVRLATLTSDAEAEALNLALSEEDRIEVPVTGWPVRGARPAVSDPPSAVFVRVSAQRYNEPVDYQRLVDALARRGLGSSPGRDLGRPRLS
jgi:selenocysteine lyase/cysteine desulfurase